MVNLIKLMSRKCRKTSIQSSSKNCKQRRIRRIL